MLTPESPITTAPTPTLTLGGLRPLSGAPPSTTCKLPASHLCTHGVIVGMTGSGKTGLLTVLVEEALLQRVPVLMIDVKGDLPDLLLAFPSNSPSEFVPWLSAESGAPSPEVRAASLAAERTTQLRAWGITESQLARFRAETDFRVLTPGANSGTPLHVLSALERRSARWDTDPDNARIALSAAISLVLRLLGRDPDPARSREHVLLSVLSERRLRAGQNADLPTLLGDLTTPPITDIGALPLDTFLPPHERLAFAAALNALLASPSFSSWRTGATLDVGEWMTPRDGKTPATIVSVAHLDDEERELVLGVVLQEILAWVRTRPGSDTLRGLVVFDEVYGFVPPHPANPATKAPLVKLMKQARAFGIGVILATQNPMDLDYRALANAGLWWLGRLQTDADRRRVVEGIGLAKGSDLDAVLKKLGNRYFVMRDAKSSDGGVKLLQPRWAMSWLKGPLTGTELKRAVGEGA